MSVTGSYTIDAKALNKYYGEGTAERLASEVIDNYPERNATLKDGKLTIYFESGVRRGYDVAEFVSRWLYQLSLTKNEVTE